MTVREAKIIQNMLRGFSARLRTTRDADGRTPQTCIENVAREMMEEARRLELRPHIFEGGQ